MRDGQQPGHEPQRPGQVVAFDGHPVIRFADEGGRRRFIKMAALIGAGSSLVAATRHDPLSFADATTNDLEILNYALTLEYLEADFYTRGVEGGALSGRTLELVTPIRDHEQAHVAAVKQTVSDMGGQPVDKPEFTYPDGTFTDRTKFLKTASVFEELGVTAYHGQVPRVDDPEILKAAAAIAGVESRHAAILADLIGGNPFPSAFEKSMSMDEVLEAAGDFIK